MKTTFSRICGCANRSADTYSAGNLVSTRHDEDIAIASSFIELDMDDPGAGEPLYFDDDDDLYGPHRFLVQVNRMSESFLDDVFKLYNEVDVTDFSQFEGVTVSRLLGVLWFYRSTKHSLLSGGVCRRFRVERR